VIQDTAAKGQTDPRALYQQRAFDSKLAKSFLDAGQIAAATKTSVVTTVRVKARLAQAA
jgi:hypothetical protein